MNYGEAFEKMGVAGMGRIGAPWCGLNQDGVMVLMAHQSAFRKGKDGFEYLDKGLPEGAAHSNSAKRSINLLADYFEPNKRILLLIAEFTVDGGLDKNGKVVASEFKTAKGSYYNAEMIEVNRETGFIHCNCISRH